MAELHRLSLAEWIVLTLIDENPTHGFAVAALTADTGEVGRAWQVPRPIVYRAADRLVELGLARVASTEAGARGPQRSILTSTRSGRSATRAWLTRPVTHVRDMRPELLVKLALVLRRNRSTTDLIVAQLQVFTPIEAALARQLKADTEFESILTTWRLENVRAAIRFLADVSKLAQRSPSTPNDAATRSPQR